MHSASADARVFRLGHSPRIAARRAARGGAAFDDALTRAFDVTYRAPDSLSIATRHALGVEPNAHVPAAGAIDVSRVRVGQASDTLGWVGAQPAHQERNAHIARAARTAGRPLRASGPLGYADPVCSPARSSRPARTAPPVIERYRPALRLPYVRVGARVGSASIDVIVAGHSATRGNFTERLACTVNTSQ